MKKAHIWSAVVGGACFAVPYFLEILSPGASLIVGVLGYGAGNLMFSDFPKDVPTEIKDDNIEEILQRANKMNSKIIQMLNRVEDDDLKQDIREIFQTAEKIIKTVKKDHKKIKNVENFFTYYLPETLKLLEKYDEIENQRLGKTGDEFLLKTRKMVSKIKEAFKQQLAHLYQEDFWDTDAEMKVFDSMLKSDGYGENDFKL